MINSRDIHLHERVQRIAKVVLNDLANWLNVGMSEAAIVNKCIAMLKEHGVHETWYYNTPALVLVGKRSILSISGRGYTPSAEVFAVDGDLVTVDLSPSVAGRWGDCARSFVIGQTPSDAIADGFDAEVALHRELTSKATPSMTFGEVHSLMARAIEKLGFENLDFLANLGHSIALDRHDRVFIERGNQRSLGSVAMFTFEPHIRRPGTLLGFKHENIYYFDSSHQLREL
jgi:Xaa-Pro aminopeptidase